MNSTFIEPLELRIAPATLVNPTTVTFQDLDGDTVTLKLSKPLFAAATVDDLLKFSTGGTGGDNTVPQQLQLIDLTILANPATVADGVKITVSAKRSPVNGGDGLANIGAILATGVNLGLVKIAGDLGQIDAGTGAGSKPALAGLDVKSMGEYGLSTQAAGGSLVSTLAGSLGTLKIAGNVREASIAVLGEAAGIKSIAIGGSVFGGAADDTGRISALGNIGSILVKGSLEGRGGERSAQIFSAGKVSKATILGSLVGGDGNFSGQLVGESGLGTVRIGRDLKGGVGDESASIDGGLAIGALTIGGSMIGNAGEESASILAESFGGSVKSIVIGGDVCGGAGEESAYIHADLFLGPITVKGSVIGGDGTLSAAIYAGNAISTQSTMVSVTIFGDLRGGDLDPFAGAVGNAGFQLGAALALDIGKVVIKGSLIGGAADGGAEIRANDIKSISIGGSLVGTVNDTATIRTTGTLGSLTITGSIYGGTGTSSGRILPVQLGTLKIGGNLEGGSGNFSGEISVDPNGLRLTEANTIKSITILGAVKSGAHPAGGALHINAPVGALTIGSALGTPANPVEIEVRGKDGATKPLALGKLAVKGGAEFLDVLVGFQNGAVVNVDAALGPVTVGGDWIAGSISASVQANGEGGFGTPDDQVPVNNTAAISSIASITIKGKVLGTVGGTDHFGFVAQKIGKLKVGTVTYPFTAGGFEAFTLGSTLDFSAVEISQNV